MFEILIVLALCQLQWAGGYKLHRPSDDFIDRINKEGNWKAERNFPPNTNLKHIKQLAGAKLDFAQYEKLPTVEYDQDIIDNLPETFDPREKWPNCPSLSEIRDQGECGSCWAFATVSTMTDRVCTYSNGTKNFHFSAEDLITCNSEHEQCFGGSPLTAWQEWIDHGLVSGGNYGSNEGCKPYSIPICHDHLKSCTKYKRAPACSKTCREGYNVTYNDDKKRGKRYYFLRGEDNIKAEIYQNGPVAAGFLLYEDFANYTSGIYQHVTGQDISGHAVKMLGWGVENGTKYWLLANSWGTDFGETGFFRMLRGVNECFIELLVTAAEPLMEDYQ